MTIVTLIHSHQLITEPEDCERCRRSKEEREPYGDVMLIKNVDKENIATALVYYTDIGDDTRYNRMLVSFSMLNSADNWKVSDPEKLDAYRIGYRWQQEGKGKIVSTIGFGDNRDIAKPMSEVESRIIDIFSALEVIQND